MQKILLLLFTLPAFHAHAQCVADSASHRPLAGASIRVSDSTLRTTDAHGRFTLGTLPPGEHHLTISYMGYPQHRISFSNTNHLPDTIFLSGYHGKDLQEVVVISHEPAVRMKGDTLEYNADRFRTKPDATVEDLLRTLPGMRVERDGSLKSQGQQVQRVLVDGKEFFGSDPTIATRNLPADMISKVQVLDKRSDMAEFTGVEDGKKMKTINLVTKKGRKKGLFGNVNGGTDANGHYEAGVNLNAFSGEMQLSLLAKGNNINKSGFSSGELLQMLIRNPQMSANLPASAVSELLNVKGVSISSPEAAAARAALRPQGFTDTRFGGINFNNDWGENLEWRSDYFTSDNRTRNNYSSDRHNFLADTAYVYRNQGSSIDNSMYHKLETSADIRINKKNSIKVAPRFLYNKGNNSEQTNYQSLSSDEKTLLNEGSQETWSTHHNNTFATDILYRHRFAKERHTFALSVSPEFAQANYTGYQRSANQFYNVKDSSRTDQRTTSSSNNFSLGASPVYTLPLAKTLSLQTSASTQYAFSNNKKLVHSFDPASQTYSIIDERYSDTYNTSTLKTTPDLTLAIKNKKLDVSAGIGIEWSRLQGHSTRKDYAVHNSFTAFTPHLYAEYAFNQRKKLRLNVETNAGMPSMQQLQPLDDNSNPLVTYRGNPLLAQEITYRASLSGNFSSRDMKRSSYGSLEWETIRNRISNNTTIDGNTGKQLIYPINTSGYYSGKANAGASWQLDENGSSISSNMSILYTQETTLFDARPAVNRNFSFIPDVDVNYYIGTVVSIGLNGNVMYNNRHFSMQPDVAPSWSFNYSANVMATLPRKISLEADWDNYATTGLSAGFNSTVSLLKATVTKGFGKYFIVKFSGEDLLNRNRSFNRITGAGFYEDRRNDMLGRYFQLSAIYRIQKFPTKK